MPPRPHNGVVKLQRKHALVLLGIAAWNVITWATFIRNLAKTEGRPTGYYVAHAVLIVVNLVIAAVLGKWGYSAYKQTRGESRVKV